MKHLLIIFLLVLLPLSSAGAAGGPTYLPLVQRSCASAPAYYPPDDLQMELDMAAAINAERAANGLPALALDNRLTQAARRHSADMAANQFVEHTGSDGSSPGLRMEQACYDWNYWGEIIGAGYPTVEAMLDGWLNSPPHRAILLDSNYQDFGVGYVYDAANPYHHFWTVDFGRQP